MRLLLAFLLAGSAQAEVLFEDHSSHLPPHQYDGGWEHFVGGGAAVFDCNGDALPDILAAGGENPATLLVNLGQMRFATHPLPELRGMTGAYPLDLDADGAMDVMTLRVGENTILRGDGACGFASANAAFGFEGGSAWSTAFSATWVDDKPVLAIGNYVDRDDPNGPFEACDENSLHRWDGTRFEAEPLSPGYCALSILFARDATGRTRLRLSNDRHYYVRGGHEQMYDLAEARFLGPADGWENISLWGMGIASRDLTGDGRAEVMLTSMGDQLLQIAGENGIYQAAPYEFGTYAQRPHVGDDGRPSTGWHAEFGDVNNDTLPDLFIAKGNVDQMPGLAMEDPNNLLIQRPDGRFIERSIEAGTATTKRSRGGALADFDGDGRLDLLVVNRRAPLEIYRNISAQTGHWLQITPEINGANRNAVGALVEVSAGGAKQVQEITIGGGHASGQMGPLHFGLGRAEKAKVTITWPDGQRSTFENIAVNQRITLRP